MAIVLIGAHIDGTPQRGINEFLAVEQQVGPLEIVHWFQAWGGGYGAFEPPWLDLVSASGKTGLITWEPWALTGEAHQPAYNAESIAAGAHDDYIRSWADGFAARTDGPWYLRPMHEMNGDWYPWSGGVEGNDPIAFRAAWAHVHDLFRARGAGDVVRWVWCPLVDDRARPAAPFEAYYPGEAFIDVLALDGYNWGASHPQNGGWRSPREVFDTALERLMALGPQPVWLAEIGCAPDGGDKAAWIDELGDLARVFARSRRPLEAVVFFNLDKECDWRIDANSNVAAAVPRLRSPHPPPD